MFQVTRRLPALSALALLLAGLVLIPAAAARSQEGSDKAKDEPPFREYRGVRIGMPASEARKLLGTPAEKDDRQDYYTFGENESCEVYYDEAKKVSAVKITFLGGKSVPAPKSVLGDEPEAKQDGSIYKMIRFPKVGYWLAYTRTAGDSPMTIIAMQKIQ